MDEFYLQDKRQYVGNDLLWWCATGGYTTDLSRAEIFTKEKAMSQHRCRPDVDIPWPKSYIDAKTRPAVDMQYVDIKEALQGSEVELIKPEKPKKEVYKCGHCAKFVSQCDYYSKVYNGFPCSNCED